MVQRGCERYSQWNPGAPESYDADAHAPVYPADKRILKEAGESHCGGRPALHVLQLCSYPSDAPRYACNGCWRHKKTLGGVRYCRDVGAVGVGELQAGISIRGPQYAIGKGHSVSVMWRGGEVDTIFGFEKEADAIDWIK